MEDRDTWQRNWTAHIREGNFVKVKALGNGTFGLVELGYFEDDPDRPVAKRLLGSRDEHDIAPESDRFFMRELDIFVSIRPTLTICTFYGYSMSPDVSLFVEYLPNGTLAHVLSTHDPHWTDTVRAKTVFGFACAMMHLHNHGAMHRFLSPQNIMFDGKWEPRLVDFGFAKAEATLGRQTQQQAGANTRYFAPELLDDAADADYTPSVDVFAFGTILWQILTGQTPLGDLTFLKLTDAVKRCDALPLPPGTDPTLASLIGECRARGPEVRPTFVDIVKGLRAHDRPLFPETDMTEYRLYRDRVLSAAYLSRDAKAVFDADDIALFGRAKAAADAGNAVACARVGRLYSEGRGVARNTAEAKRYLTLAADAGDPIAMYHLGIRLAGDRPEESRRWMAAAAAVPTNLAARVELAEMLAQGTGGPAEPERALAIMEEAARPPWSDGTAQYFLAKHLKEGDILPQDLARARKLYTDAAKGGHVGASVQLANMYLRGEGGGRDAVMAETILKQAADKGNPRACSNLSSLYAGTEAPELKNPAESRRMLERAVALDDVSGMARLASQMKKEVDANTELEPRTRREAEKKIVLMLKRAADLGYPPAMNSYGKLRLQGYGLVRDFDEGFEYLIRAAELDSPQALENLAEAIRTGVGGIERDPKRADALARRAIDIKRTGKRV